MVFYHPLKKKHSSLPVVSEFSICAHIQIYFFRMENLSSVRVGSAIKDAEQSVYDLNRFSTVLQRGSWLGKYLHTHKDTLDYPELDYY